jgi:hypothetical protein
VRCAGGGWPRASGTWRCENVTAVGIPWAGIGQSPAGRANARRILGRGAHARRRAARAAADAARNASENRRPLACVRARVADPRRLRAAAKRTSVLHRAVVGVDGAGGRRGTRNRPIIATVDSRRIARVATVRRRRITSRIRLGLTDLPIRGRLGSTVSRLDDRDARRVPAGDRHRRRDHHRRDRTTQAKPAHPLSISTLSALRS